MIEIKAPNLATEKDFNACNNFSVFLAGSIEMGKAVDWQSRLVKELKDEKILFFNPRRTDWDSSWEQSIHNKKFNEQVNWELTHLERAKLVVFFLAKDTVSPISLMELGLVGGTKYDIIVFCEEGFQRKGNVDIFCERYGIPQVNSFDALTGYIKKFNSKYPSKE